MVQWSWLLFPSTTPSIAVMWRLISGRGVMHSPILFRTKLSLIIFILLNTSVLWSKRHIMVFPGQNLTEPSSLNFLPTSKPNLKFSHLHSLILTPTNLTFFDFSLIMYLYKEMREVIKELPIRKKIQLSLVKTTFELSQN